MSGGVLRLRNVGATPEAMSKVPNLEYLLERVLIDEPLTCPDQDLKF